MKNLIILCTDEMRGDCLRANGMNPDALTPNMDALAGRGVLMKRHFTPFPKCVPARISMMTGRYCHTDAYRDIHQHMPSSSPDLLTNLLASGYEAALFGINHVWENLFEATHTPPQLKPGQIGHRIAYHSWTAPFSEIFRKHQEGRGDQNTHENEQSIIRENGVVCVSKRDTGWMDRSNTGQAIEFLRNRRDKNRPFYMHVNLGKPHPPYEIPEPYFSMFDREKITPFPMDLPENAPLPLAKNRELRLGKDVHPDSLKAIQAVYLGMIKYVDDLFGQIIETIDAENLWENTTILLISDHGDFAGQYGCFEKWDTCFNDCLMHVPCALVDPDLPSGTAVEALSDHTDIAPTLCELLGITSPGGAHGSSLLPVIRGKSDGRKAVFADGGHEAEARSRVVNPGPRPSPEGFNSRNEKQEVYWMCPDSMARAKMIRTDRYKLVIRETGGNELYDLADDPWELKNRYGEPALLQVQCELQQSLIEWCLRTDPDRPRLNPVGA